MPKKRYQAAIDSKQLNHDEMQMRVVDHLDTLHAQLTLQASPDDNSFSNKLTGIFRRPKNNTTQTQGLYIWGSVGRGKLI